MSCRNVREWLHREAESLDATQRLQLDDHLAACERCRGDRARMLALHRVGAALQAPPEGAREYNRAIARALLEGPLPLQVPARRPRVARIALPLTAAAIAATVFAIVSRREHSHPREVIISSQEPLELAGGSAVPSPPLAPSPAPASGDVVEAGHVIAGGNRLQAGAPVPERMPLHAPDGAQLRLTSVRVVLAAKSEIRWSRVEHQVALHVDRGAARVIDLATDAGVATVAAGESWPAPTAAPRRDTTARELLARAHRDFGARAYDRAERNAVAALARKPTTAEEADARMILAETAQASGRLGLAVERYELVASSFPTLAAAETALHAASRIELRRGRHAAARALLERYLLTYPAGRYAADSRRLLATLP